MLSVFLKGVAAALLVSFGCVAFMLSVSMIIEKMSF